MPAVLHLGAAARPVMGVTVGEPDVSEVFEVATCRDA